MRPLQAAVKDYEFTKYLQLLPITGSDDHSRRTTACRFSYTLPERSILRDALATYMELLRLRLAVHGAFMVLTDENTPYFLAGTPVPQSCQGTGSPVESAGWLGTSHDDLRQWRDIFRQTTSIDTTPETPLEGVFSMSSLNENCRTSNLTSVCRAPHLSFYAGAPVCSKHGVPVGAVFVVDNSERQVISSKDCEHLTTTAKKCMDQLESARESAAQERWKRMNGQLGRFIGSRAIKDQQLEEPPSLGKADQWRRRQEEVDELQDLAFRHGHDPSKANGVALPERDYEIGAESKRLLDAELETRQHIVKDDEMREPRSITGQADDDSRRDDSQGETTYRKVFRRAAECLQHALQVDGVLFTDGLLGHHGTIQPMAEAEDDLEREIVQRPGRETFHEEVIGDDPVSHEGGKPHPDASRQQQWHPGKDKGTTATRTYTSPEYRRGIRIERRPEILGMALSKPDLAPECSYLNERTLGLARADEGFLQLLMNRHPDGSVWYFSNTTTVCYRLTNDALMEEESAKDMRRFIASFPGVRQMLFQPLTDPVSLKRLAGCFAWSTRPFPVLTDSVDLPSLRGFLHVLESEVARIDASAAVKQKEAFVSSVSHELRTPLHGILGSVQLLADTDLDPFQMDLAETIKSSGSTLNETLTSVLSYARINQFERQQHKYRIRRPPDVDWSLPNKIRFSQGPDMDFKSLYICTNIAILCEEIAGVLDAGQSYDGKTKRRNVTIVVEVDYQDNWNYFTEPGALRRIAINIIGNALKYTMEGSVTISLSASEPDQNDKIGAESYYRRVITLSVSDTGKGISQEFMDTHLFVPFTQEDTTSSHGVGLGMSIVKGLVSLLAGEISVASQLGKGTEVTVAMPMRVCDPEHGKIESPGLEMERCIISLRRERLSVVLFGFSSVVRRGLERYLCEWFHCKLLEATDGAEPDVVLIEEGNEGVAKDVERTAHAYGRRGVLLSVVMARDGMGKRMRLVAGFKKWERIPRPIGPGNIGRALSTCIDKLRELREIGDSNEQGCRGESSEQSRDDNRNVTEDVPKPSKDQSAADAAKSGNTTLPQMEYTLHELTDTSDNTPFPTHSKKSAVSSHSKESSVDPSNLRVLIVEDNAVNRKLLGAFLKKYGCGNVQFAENGALAVDAVELHSEAFDVIFMDLSMPVMNGFKATREIRRIERQRRSSELSSGSVTPSYIIALTGLASDDNEDEALAAGVDMFLTKPLQFDKLAKILREWEEGGTSSG